MTRRLVSGNDLRALARLVDDGLAEGDMRVDRDCDSDFDYVGIDLVSSRRLKTGERYTIEIAVRTAGPMITTQIAYRQISSPRIHREPEAEKVDPGPALDWLVKTVKELVIAWADSIDDTQIRFAQIELD
jgi:hypothetical protein